MRKRNSRAPIVSRKQQHVELTLTKEVGFRIKTTGLERLEFTHNALPELNLSDIDTSTVFLGRNLACPLMISCMTGGYPDALKINRQLAEVCDEAQIAMGVGSQRQALEDATYHKTFSIVRDVAPHIPLVGNIGAAEVARMTGPGDAERLVRLIAADAFAVHLNPLQELLQPEGNPNFRGVLNGVAMLVKGLRIPVIVKEIGAGISADVARRLLEIGVRHIDIAGAGGTSWAGVEILRRRNHGFADSFWDWGIPTSEALRQVSHLKTSTPFTLIASGGIATGLEAAKAVALGADIVASARPMLVALHRGGKEGLRRFISAWMDGLRGAMFLTGSANLKDLQHAELVTPTPA